MVARATMQSVVDTVSSALGSNRTSQEENFAEARRGEINPPVVSDDGQYELGGPQSAHSSVSAPTAVEQGMRGNPGAANAGEVGEANSGDPVSLEAQKPST